MTADCSHLEIFVPFLQLSECTHKSTPELGIKQEKPHPAFQSHSDCKFGQHCRDTDSIVRRIFLKGLMCMISQEIFC